MRAIVRDRFGGPEELRLDEVEEPTPGDEDVVIRVHASSVNSADLRILRADPSISRLAFGLRRPRHRVLGRDVAGVVASVGAKVTRLRPGDRVCCEADDGAYAEFVRVPEQFVAAIPEALSFEQAATIPLAGGTALQAVRAAGPIGVGTSVLVTGASGNVGLFAVQFAAASGAEVTAVCSGAKADLVRQAGAGHVIDYRTQDVTAQAERYDVVIDIAGDRPWSQLRRVLAPKGTLVLVSGGGGPVLGPLPNIAGALVASPFVSQRLVSVAAVRRREDVERIAAMVAAGEVTPVIGRVVPLDQVPEAFRLLEAGEARGKLVIAV
jgi:NADPH:quinone reductase-like Zn-dependent oxidoreductase